ncbi:hypothetical protein EVAR_5158_1 [Eumeta japonica]|uniref:Uncharacterized protein n=1 Tax=Eumeta variegata TaxID=151549 RepID=A0A4C1SUN3_EUMVA|nr:hypothetical protein EVAR_5158_1 [Eumeta japonica]
MVREHLNNCFPYRWIGRDGPIPRPARLPYLTPYRATGTCDLSRGRRIKNERIARLPPAPRSRPHRAAPAPGSPRKQFII